MQDRFKFNAIVTGYYDIDTPDEYSEFEPQIYLENVDIWSGGDIGVSRDDLELAIKNQYPNIEKSQFNQIVKFFEDNSNSSDNEVYLTILPYKIIQCTALKDKNGKLIYEGDILKGKKNMICSPHSSRMIDKVGVVEIPQNMFVATCRDVKNNCTLFCQNDWVKTEVIGNIYENPELLKDRNNDNK